MVRAEKLSADGQTHSLSFRITPELFLPDNHFSLGLVIPEYRDCLKPFPGKIQFRLLTGTRIGYSFAVASPIPKMSILPSLLRPDPGGNTPLAIVFPSSPGPEELQAAGIMASWMGTRFRFSEISYRVFVGDPPLQGNAIIFRHPGISLGSALPNAEKVTVIPNPVDPSGKFLVLSGTRGADFVSLVRRLVLESRTEKGRFLEPMRSLAGEEKSPVWIDFRKPVFVSRLSETSRLSVHGFPPPAIEIGFELPPALFTWNTPGLLFHYRLHYDLPYQNAKVALLIRADRHQVLYRVLPQGPDGNTRNLLIDGHVTIPYYDLGRLNRIRIDIVAKNRVLPYCGTAVFGTTRYRIDPGSTLSLAGSHIVAFLPDLSLWLHWGYPFTSSGDLSGSVILLGSTNDLGIFSQFLDMIGRWGQVTGIVSSNVKVIFPGAPIPPNQNLLVLGTFEWAKAQKNLFGRLPLDWKSDRVLPRPTVLQKMRLIFERLFSFQGIGPALDLGEKNHSGPPPDLTVFSFRSPFDSSRTLVTVLWNGPVRWNDSLLESLDRTRTQSQDGWPWLYARFHKGQLEVTDLSTLPQYPVGNWSITDRILFDLSRYEFLSIAFGGIGVACLWYQANRIRQKQIRKRLPENREIL